MDTSDFPQLDATLLATDGYLKALSALDDDDMRAPSLLPGWSRGHVVCHLARNADGMAHALRGAAAGHDAWMYSSQESRNTDIDAGAGRSADALREDATVSSEALRTAAGELPAELLSATVTRVPGDASGFSVSKLMGMRRTEVEIHHADLGIGYSPADWPTDFAVHMIKRRQAELGTDGPSMVLSSTDVDGLWKFGPGPGPEVTGTAGQLAWWLVGRGAGQGLESSTGELPRVPSWR
ncbi:MAG TPA: maleylpyruvate isomerase family mycothiol-dependent enzyme [Nocardioidaceae bacterium]|nr:maleylpyruvate isomerase family mycothiol-dependent enzyme [Nocardioidaceae bacterium]